MTIEFQNRVEVETPCDRVWSYLSQPARVIHCLPGATLSQVVDADTFNCDFRTKVGPLSLAYRGIVEVRSRHPSTHTLQLAAQARERAGKGSADVGVVIEIAPQELDRSTIEFHISLKLSGPIVNLGRHAIEHTLDTLFGDFSNNLRETIEASVTVDSPIDLGEIAPKLKRELEDSEKPEDLCDAEVPMNEHVPGAPSRAAILRVAALKRNPQHSAGVQEPSSEQSAEQPSPTPEEPAFVAPRSMQATEEEPSTELAHACESRSPWMRWFGAMRRRLIIWLGSGS
ncbi:MAG: SRPBCC domain-containing protein [Myxococcota bacterium]